MIHSLPISKRQIEKDARREKKSILVAIEKGEAKDMVVPYPGRPSEAEIQGWIWEQLRRMGIDARMDVVHAVRRGVGASILSRFDIVCYIDKNPFVIIEVKKDGSKQNIFSEKQRRKYQCYGVPLVYCRGESWVMDTCIQAKSLKETYQAEMSGV